MWSGEGWRRAVGRREVLVLGMGAFVAAGLPLAVVRRREVVRRTVPVMGTIAEIAVVHREPAAAHRAIDAAVEALGTVEARMTRFSATSDVGRANRLAAARAVPIDRTTATVLGAALGWAEASDGAFDPCLGAASRLWDVGHRRTPPAAAEVRPLAGRRLYRALDVATGAGTPAVRFAAPDVELDLGGIAKGYGVDRAVDALRQHGVTAALVTVGGDLYALGDAPDGRPWRVGIRAAEAAVRVVADLDVRDAAVATSGDYLRFFEHGGRRYHHLLDPLTGAPRVTPLHSVTVTAATCMDADAAATTAYGMSPARAERVLVSRAASARVVHMIVGDA